MIDQVNSFIKDVALENADVCDIYEYIHLWHISNTNLSIAEFLGMSEEDYHKFLDANNKDEVNKVLNNIINKYKSLNKASSIQNVKIKKFLKGQ